MRKLKIDTYSNDTSELKESVSVPLGVAQVLVNILPQKLSSKFEENGEQLEALVHALKDTTTKGVLLEVEDQADNERVVISVV